MTNPTTTLGALRALMKAVERCEDNDFSPSSRAHLAAMAGVAATFSAKGPAFAVSPTPTFDDDDDGASQPMAAADAAHRLRMIANDVDRLLVRYRGFDDIDRDSMQAAYMVILGVERNLDDGVHDRGVG